MKFVCQIFGVIFFFSQSLTAQDIKFRRISLEQGLSQSTIKSILKDKNGYMWFGTRDGIDKYDGYKITVYKNDPEKSESLSDNFINEIFEDKSGNLWIGTKKGFDLFDRDKDSFIRYNPDDTPTDVRDIYQDRKGNIWLGTKSGLYLFDFNKNTFKKYQNDAGNPNSLASNSVNRIVEDRHGKLWIATNASLDRFDPHTQIFTHYKNEPENSKSILGNDIRALLIDQNHNLWAGVNEKGLSMYSEQNNSFVNFVHDPLNDNSLTHNEVLCLEEDKEGRLWIGTQDGGLSIFDYKKNIFTNYRYNVADNASISHNSIHSLYVDKVGNVWVGTWAGGVNLYSKYAEKFSYFKRFPNINGTNIYAITGDHEGNIWLGIEGGELTVYNRRKRIFTTYKNDNKDLKTNCIFSILEINKDTLGIVYHRGGFAFFNRRTHKFTHYIIELPNNSKLHTFPSIYKDKTGNIWIGGWGGGVNLFDKKKNGFITYRNDNDNPKSISNSVVYGMYEDSKGNFWVGTENGLNLFNREKGEFTRYMHDDKNSQSISNNIVYSILEDHKNNLWVGTAGGLNLFDARNQSFKSFREKDGLPNDVIPSMLEDSRGNMWLGTNRGLSKFNIQTKTFRNYDTRDGVQGNEFNRNACYKTASGEMYFGGTNGFNIFHPDSINDNPNIPPIVLTDFQVFNESVKIGDNDSPLKKHISETKEIVLPYFLSVITLQYAALSYSATSKNQYAYKLEGFDRDWNNIGTKRFATYTNLNPGKYEFRVKGCNNDGVWNEKGTSIRLIITPPFWETWWFRILIVATIMGSAFAWYQARMNIVKRQKEKLEQQVKDRTGELQVANVELICQKEELQTSTENLTNQSKVLQEQSKVLQDANEEINILYSEIQVLFSEIKDSIRAAEAIQKSILPSQNFIKQHLPESFILYMPKDVVSGDFYWFDVVGDKIIIAAVDCTGHGVSGAFMSINGHHLLNQSIYPYKELVASQILDRLNDGVINGLHAEGENMEVQDGMDIALCILDKENLKLQYSGANNPLYILRGKEIIQVKANKFAIGLTMVSNVLFNKFSNKVIDLQEGDIIYIFSDGYADQIGGADSEKFMYPRFRELLISNGHKSMDEQLLVLNESLTNWQGKNEQMDDVLVMGFKI